MALPFLSSRSTRGGAFAAGPAAPVAADEGVTAQDILDMNPLWWLDADAAYVEEGSGDPVEADGDNVTTWLDRSGDDRDFIGYHAGFYPHWYESGTNAKPYVWFDADRLRYIADANYGTPMCLYFVMSFDTDTQSALSLIAATNSVTTYNSVTYSKGFRPHFGTTGSPIYNDVQNTTTSIIQVLAEGTDGAHKVRVNGGADLPVLLDATSTTENLINSAATMYLGLGLKFKLYHFMVIPNVTHNQDTVFGYFGQEMDISVTPVS